MTRYTVDPHNEGRILIGDDPAKPDGLVHCFDAKGALDPVLAATLCETLNRNGRAQEALQFYADPDSYIAIGFVPDPPCGEFIEDFSEVETEWGTEVRPGKRARAALATPQPATTEA